MKENKCLKSQIEDLDKTIKINKNIIDYSTSQISFPKYKDIITDLQNENTRLTKQNIELYNENLNLETKMYKKEKEADEKISQLEKKIINLTNNLFIFDNKLKESENIVLTQKKELNKYVKDDYFITNKEIFVSSPNEFNLIMNNELCETRELLTKYSHFLNDANKKIVEQESKINDLKEIIINLKQGKKIKKNIENIETFNYILSSDSNSESSEENEIIDSPIEQIPTKIKHQRYLTSYCNNSNTNAEVSIPKLDLSKIINKYRPISKKSKRDDKNSKSEEPVIDEEYLEKIKYQNKLFKEINKKYKKKCKEQSKIISMLKINILKSMNKRNSGASTTDEKRNKEHINTNTLHNDKQRSLENIRDIINDEELIDFENDFNALIKEYNQNELHSIGETNINYNNNTNEKIIIN